MDRLKNFGFLLKEVSRRYVLRFEQHAQQTLCLTLTQCKALVQLERNEGASQARLAELTEVEPMTMVRILDRMEADQLLERRPDPADRRARCLYLTDKARPLLDEIWRIADITRGDVFTGIGEADRDSFMRILEQLHGNLSALDAPVPDAPACPAPPDAPALAAPLAMPAKRGRNAPTSPD
jgi:MarR family transcriptional regulator for hemolysin